MFDVVLLYVYAAVDHRVGGRKESLPRTQGGGGRHQRISERFAAALSPDHVTDRRRKEFDHHISTSGRLHAEPDGSQWRRWGGWCRY